MRAKNPRENPEVILGSKISIDLGSNPRRSMSFLFISLSFYKHFLGGEVWV